LVQLVTRKSNDEIEKGGFEMIERIVKFGEVGEKIAEMFAEAAVIAEIECEANNEVDFDVVVHDKAVFVAVPDVVLEAAVFVIHESLEVD